MVCRMFQLRFKKQLSALCPDNMPLSFCYESKNKMVSVVQSIDYFFLLRKKMVVRVVFAPSHEFLVLKRPFEA